MPVRAGKLSPEEMIKGARIIFGGWQTNSSKANSPSEKEPDSSQFRPATKEEWKEFEANEKALTEALKRHKPPIQFG